MYKFNKKLIFNKIILDNSKYFLLMIFSFGVIVWVIQAVNFVDFITEDGHGFDIYFKYTFLNFPKIITELAPLIFFISLFLTLTKYEENNELKVFWFTGISKDDLTRQILKYSLIITLILLTLQIFIVPYFANKARSFIQSSNVDFFPSLIKEKQFVDTVSDLTLFIEKKDGDIFKNIFLQEYSNESKRIIYAKEGWLLVNETKKEFRLINGKIININKKNYTEFNFKDTSYDLSKYLTKSVVDFKIQEKSTYLIASCFWNFYVKKKEEFYDVYNCNEQALDKMASELYKRIFKPIFIMVLALITSFILNYAKEDKLYKKNKIIIFLISFLVIILSEIIHSIITKNYIHLLISFSLPFITYLLIFILKKKIIFN
jgi:lipopolysaccharide export system permease protein